MGLLRSRAKLSAFGPRVGPGRLPVTNRKLCRALATVKAAEDYPDSASRWISAVDVICIAPYPSLCFHPKNLHE